MIYLGDLFDVLPKMEAESLDACATDPPYGIGVMGKEWDTFKPGEESKRIVPNQAIESDNPNLKGRRRSPASSPSAVEYNRSLEGQRAFQAWTERWAREVFRVLKPGAHILVCGAPRSFHRMTSGLEDAGFVVRDCLSWLYGQGFPKSLNIDGGRGTALKPAWEPIVLARKPLFDTLKMNALLLGTGALNIDECRIRDEKRFNPPAGTTPTSFAPINVTDYQGQTVVGRWPPNVLLDKEAALMLDTQTGESVSRIGQPRGAASGDGWGMTHTGAEYNDRGGASRFFYVAKPGGGERDKGCYDLDPRAPTELTGRKEGSAGLKHARAGTDRKTTNFHPTVKPVALMEWLVKLITPPGGTVLDPFMGSGTTGMAARLAERKFVGVEREAEYVEIAWRRISETNSLFYGEEEVIK